MDKLIDILTKAARDIKDLDDAMVGLKKITDEREDKASDSIKELCRANPTNNLTNEELSAIKVYLGLTSKYDIMAVLCRLGCQDEAEEYYNILKNVYRKLFR